QYVLSYSEDGRQWKVLLDKIDNKTDVPHDYVELEQPVQARYIRLENIHMPSGKFAISGLRVFGKGQGNAPEPVSDFIVLRTETDIRSAWLKLQPVIHAYAYNIYTGLELDKINNFNMVHCANEY